MMLVFEYHWHHFSHPIRGYFFSCTKLCDHSRVCCMEKLAVWLDFKSRHVFYGKNLRKQWQNKKTNKQTKQKLTASLRSQRKTWHWKIAVSALSPWLQVNAKHFFSALSGGPRAQKRMRWIRKLAMSVLLPGSSNLQK